MTSGLTAAGTPQSIHLVPSWIGTDLKPLSAQQIQALAQGLLQGFEQWVALALLNVSVLGVHPFVALQNFGAEALGAVTNLENLINGVAGAWGHSSTGQNVADLIAYAAEIPGDVISGITTIEQDILNAIANALGHTGAEPYSVGDILTFLGAIPAGNIIGAIAAADQDLRDAVANALGHSGGEPYSAADVLGFLAAIPASVVDISGTALSALFNGSAHFIGVLDATATGALNAALTYSGTALSTVLTNITASTGALNAAGLAGALNPAVTFLVGVSNIALSTLLQNLSATGTLVGSAVTGALNGAVTLGGNAVSTLFNGSGLIASQIAGALNPAVTFLVGASNIALSTLLQNLSATGTFVASALTGALNPAVTFLVGASNIALSTLLQNLSATGTLVATALTGTWSNIYTALGAMTAGNIGNILTSWSTVLNGSALGAMSTGNITSLLTSWSNMGTALSAMTAANIATILGSWTTLLNGSGLGAMSTANITALLTSWSNVATSLSTMTVGNIGTILGSWSNLVNVSALGAMTTGNLTSLLTSWSNMATALSSMTAANIGTILGSWTTLLNGSALGAMTTGNITSLLTNWSNVITSLGSLAYTNVTNILGGANLGADVQAVVDKIVQVLNPVLSTGNAVTAITTQIQNMFGGFLPSVVDNLDGTITTLTGFTNNSDGTLSLTPVLNDIHTMVDNLDGTITSAATALQNMFFGTKSTGASATAAINHAQDVVTNTNGLTVVAAATPANTAADVAKALAGNSIVSSSSAAPWSAGTGVTYSRTWSDYPNSATFPTDFTEVSGNGGSMSLNSGFAVASAAPVVSAYAAMYHFNAGVTSTDYQIIQGVWASNIGTFGLLSSTAAGGPYLRGRASPSTIDSVDVLYSSSNTGSGSNWVLEYHNSGLSRSSTLGYFSDTFTPFAQYSLICGVGGNRRSFALLKNGVPLVPTATDDGTLSGNTLVDGSAYTALGASYRSGGLGYAACQLSMVEWVLSDYVPALLATSVGDFYINSGPTIEDVVLPTSRDFVAVQGVDLSAFSLEIPANSSLEITSFAEQYQLKSVRSGFKASRASTSTGAVVANGTIAIWGGTQNLYLFPASFFDTPSLLTSDTFWNSTTNTLTVTRTGWFMVSVGSDVSVPTNGTFLTVGFYKNGTYQLTGPQGGFNAGANTNFQTTLPVYCNANDTLTPGLIGNQSFNVMGDTNSVAAFFIVTPMNCGIITG